MRRFGHGIGTQSEYERHVAEMTRGLVTIQITIADRLTPALRRVAVDLEIMFARADGRWNRHQMISARRCSQEVLG